MLRSAFAVAAVSFLLVACNRDRAPREQPASGERPAADRGGAIASPTPPEGYVEVNVTGVASIDDGQGYAVALVGPGGNVLPIFIGGTEALTIAARHAGHVLPRPLTHDLLDSVLGTVGTELYKVQVDELDGDTYVGSVYIVHSGAIVELDARPSDAIALAIGHRVPIYVARELLQSEAAAGPGAR